MVDMIEQGCLADCRSAEDKNTKPPRGGSSSRAKAKMLLEEKGPLIARATVIIGMFMFNVVSVSLLSTVAHLLVGNLRAAGGTGLSR